MIRTGRDTDVRTLADLARAHGVTLGTLKNRKPYRAAGYPAPISSPSARVLLFDGEQVDAYLAGRPVPELPVQDDPADLLDRHEAGAILAKPVTASSWDVYKRDQALADHVRDVGGVEHWPRHAVVAWDAARPGAEGNRHRGGRPAGTGDLVPREDIQPRIEQLLDANPTLTAAEAGAAVGVHPDTATRALAAVRAARVEELLTAHPGLDLSQVTARLGYPARAARTALATAGARIRGRAAMPYLVSVVQAARSAGAPVDQEDDEPALTVRPGGAAAAAVPLEDGSALVWDERYGWRTAADAAQPHAAAGDPPTGPGIRYLAPGTTPDPDDVTTALLDRRRGSKLPKAPR
ncbi:DUF6292 family protein [Streptomyces sp. H10-C2]|uniref:DUF6292 family protein n=1 Tax=unclassified Streptomyces TaxID=2593676 RepID=UPI0024BBC1E1|nr:MULTISPECIES: DUF6292 family protein [unclassified Streptomyces]MDJ0345874.1 DUF6292 family protein [Streptomyces sp. PH10-H1]MDJ0374723.1 DUF6292 family protein [Streptomyces sp. H10-C2]